MAQVPGKQMNIFKRMKERNKLNTQLKDAFKQAGGTQRPSPPVSAYNQPAYGTPNRPLSESSQASNKQVRNLAPGQLLPGEGGVEPKQPTQPTPVQPKISTPQATPTAIPQTSTPAPTTPPIRERLNQRMSAQEMLDEYDVRTAKESAAIAGQGRGITTPFVQGQQAVVENLAAINRNALEQRAEREASGVGGVASEQAVQMASLVQSGQIKMSDIPNDIRSSVILAMSQAGDGPQATTPKQQRAIGQAGVALSAFEKIFDSKSVDGSAVGRSLFRIIPGSSAKDFSESVKTIKALVGFEELQKMRDSSPTGGALGQVSEREIDFLQALAGSINVNQSNDQLQSNLRDIQKSFQVLKLVNSPDGTTEIVGDIPLTKSGDGLYYQADDGMVYKRLPDGNFEETSFNQASPQDLGEAMRKIKAVESSGNYQARGPMVTSGQYAGERALGAYQVMPGNLPQWSQEALGRQVSEQEFLNNPQIQESIVAHQFTKNFQKYGTWDDAASVWFTGRPLARAGNAADVTGTNVQEYVNRFRQA